MKNLYASLLALVWLLAGSIQVNATTHDKATYSDGLAAAPTFTFTKTDVLLCNGQATGSISITASGGAGNYLYSKDNGASFTDTPQFTNLTAGIYQVVVKDGSNVVSGAQAVTINQPAPLTASVTSVTSTCPGLSTGAISTSAGGGVGPYQYSLNGGNSYQASSLFTGLPVGFYPLKVKDANGCVFGNTTYQVTAPTAPTVTPSVTNVSCNGLQDGSIRVTLSGGVNIGQALISINNGDTYVNDTQFHLLGVGTYPILVKYANNCLTPVQSVSVTQPSPVSFSTAITNTINCYDGTTGSIEVTAAGGSGSYLYSKDNGNTYQDGNLFGELGAGSYRIAVKDANGCTAPVQTVELSQPTAVTYTITQTDVSCFGGTDGRISIEASGGTGPYEYFFSAYGPASIRNPNDPRTTSQVADGRGARVAAGEQYNNLAAQTYYITIHDANFCYTSINATINQPSALVAETSVTNAQCNGGSSGSITVIPSGGTAPYQYSRDGGTTFQTNAQFTGLPAGNYAIVVKDAHNCLSESKSVEVSEPTVVTFTANQTDATCFGSSTGSIEVNASGGIDSYQYSRDNGATYQSSNTFTDLAAGTYPIMVKDANGCVSAAQSVTVGQPDLLTFSVTKTDVTDCFGNSSGSLSVSASGGTSYYLYSIDNGNRFTDDRFFSDLGAGTYPVMVKDANGCVTAAQNVVISQPTALTYTLTEVDVSCFGGNDGRITIDAQGGTGPYQYTFSIYGLALISNPGVLRTTTRQAGSRGARAAAGQQYNNLAAQTYYLTVRDANGCSIDLTSTVNQPSAIAVTASASPVLCAGGSNGRITVTASGGTGGYQYSKDNGANYQPTNQFDNLSAGTYPVVVKDANNCVTAVQSVTVTQPAVLTASVSKTDVTTCFGGTNGSITVTTSGGTSGYQYSRDNRANFQASNQFTSLPAGTYPVVVKDANNCVTTAQNVTIGQPTLLAFSTTKGDVTGCFGNSTGSISVTTSGGTGPYQYSKDNGATFQASNQFTNLPAGTYQVVVKDANGCVANAQSVILNQPPALSATTTATNVSCYSGTNGSITVQVTGGTAPYRYSITDGSTYQTSNQFTGLSAGSYHLLVRDANNCSLDAPTTEVTQPNAVAFSTDQVDVTCFGGNSGSITVSASGGSGAYQYSKNNGATFQASNQFPNLAAGTYLIVVKDANNCLSGVQSLTINQPNSISLTVAKTNVTTCFGGTNGTITLTASGGRNEFQYSIDNGQTYQGPFFEGLAAGTYTVLARDGYACTSSSQTVVISQPTAVSFTTAKTDVTTCFSASVGSITVTASGGTTAYQYSKDNGVTFQTSNQFTGLAAGTYQVVVKDANGCTTSAQTVVINQPSAIEASVTSMTQTCPGLSVGAYSVTATGGTGPYQYSLDDGKTYQTSPLFTGLGIGSYALAVKDANGCVVKPASYQMSSSVAPTITPQVTNVSCNGLQNGSILVDLTGGADLGQTYASINNGTTFTTNFRFNSLGADVYPVVVKYGNNCLTPVQSITLTQPAVLAFTTTKVNVTGCFGNSTGAISVTATGGTAPYQYSKDNGATFQKGNQFTDLGAGTYAVVVNDVNGCQTSAQSIVLTQPLAISYTVAKTNVSCNGSATGSFTVTASGGTPPYRLSLNGGEFDAMRSPSGLAAGDYTIAVGDANGCGTSQSTVTISQPDPLTFTSTLTEVSCAGGNNGQITLTASGGTAPYQYSKNNGATYQTGNQFANLGAGTYQVTVKDANNCVTPAQAFTITQPTPLSVVIGKTNVTTCSGATNGSISVTATGGSGSYQYSRDNGATYQTSSTFSDLAAGPYQIVVKDGNNCTTTAQTITITQPAIVTLSLSKTNVTTCFGANTGSISLTASGGTGAYQYSIDNGSNFQPGNQFTNLPAGIYQVVAKDANSCLSTTQSTTISQPSALSATTTATPVSCYSGTNGSIAVQVTGGTAPYRYSITDGSTYQFTGLSAGSYHIIVRDANNCSLDAPTTEVTQPDAVTFSISQTAVACAGGTSGSITVSASGGTGAYQYSKNNGATFQASNQFSNLAAGTYLIVVKDANECLSAVRSVSLSQPQALLVTASKTDIINCSSANTGAISLSATGGSGAYQYSINNGGSYQNSPQFTDLQAGAYAIIVKDANGCQTPTSVTVTPACCLTAVASPTTITNGQSATLTASGCSGTVSWVGGPTNSVYVVSPTQTTSYTAICAINGAGTCRSEVTVTFNPLCAISVVAKPATITNGQSSTLTVSGCGGAIGWVGTAQEGPIYIVNPTQTTTYTAICTLSASNTCSSSVTVTVNQPVCNLTTSASPTTITNGQSATLTASGCSGNITWTNTEQTGASIIVRPSATTTYIATCSIPTSGSPVSCTSAVTVTVNQPVCNLSTSASPTTITSGQSSTLTANGCSGAVYWSGGGVDRGGNSIVVNPTQTTSYTASCVITTSGDPVICTSEVTVTIGQPVCSITTSASPLTITNGQSSTLTASGCAGAVSWVSGPTNSVYVVNPTQTTTYTAICTLSASNTCTSVVTVTVNQPVCALTTSASPLTITNGQSATLTASGCGGTVSWAGGPASSVYVVNPTQTTSYTATCSIATSGAPVTCTSVVTVTVNQPACNLTTSASPTTITIGQSATLTASGCSGTITWTTTEQTGSSIVVSPSLTTTYIATCTIPTSGSPVSCTSAVTVTVNPIPCTLTTSASPLTITNGQSATLTASGCTGAISWVGTAQEGPVYIVNPTQTTTYTAICTLSASNTCTSVVTVTVNQPVCNLTTSASPTTITNGQSATLTASGCSGTVNWVGGPANSIYVVNPTQTTSYTAICSIATSGAPVTCTSIVTVTVNQPPCNLVTSASPTTITNGQSATLTASGCSGTITWTTTEQTGSSIVVRPSATTTYIATCSIPTSGSPVSCTSAVTVTVNPIPCTLTTSASPLTITNGQSATLTATGCSGTVSWNGGPTNSVYVVNPTQTTSYTAICSIATSGSPVTCTSIVTVTVNQPACNLVTSASPTTITNGQSATLTASGCSGSITWTNTEQTGSSIVVRPSATTTYIATCSIPTSGSPVSCTSAVTVTVNPIPCTLTTSASPATITNGQSSTLTASSCSGAVRWAGTAQEGPIYVVNPTQTTTYTAICSLSASNTCSSSVTVTVNQPVCNLTTSASPTTITNGQSSTLTASGCSGTVNWVGGPVNSIYVVNPTQTTSYTAICSIATSGAPVTCTSIVTVTVNQPPCNLVTSASPTTITNGQSATLTASGCSGSITWTNTEQTGSSIVVRPSATTTYIATCSIPTSGSPVSCTSAVTVTVNQPVCALTTSASPTTITSGQSSTLTASGCSGTITWTNTEQTGSSIVVSPSNTTTYIATCSIPTSGSPVSCTSAVTVTVNPIPCTLTTSASPLTITNGQSSTLTASGCSGTVSWVGGPTNLVYVVNPTQTTTYTAICTLSASNTCTSVVTVTVNQPVCALTTSASPLTITNGQSATLTATGCSGTVSWVGGPTNSVYVVNPTQTTSYTAICSIATSGSPVTCTSIVTVTVNQPPCNLTTSASPTTITVGQSSTLTASGCSGTITWTNTEQTGSSIVVRPSLTTSYIATCSIPTSGSPVSCTSAVTVTVNPIPCTLTTSASPATITNGQSSTLTASSCSGAVRWVGTAQEGPIYVVKPTQTTTYTAICSLSESNTCSSQVTVIVNQPPCNLVTSASPLTITNGQSSTLTASGCSGTVNWVGGPANSIYVVNPTQTTSYTAICSIATSGARVTCTSVVTLTVNQPACNLTTSVSSATITNGQSATLTATGCSGTVSWVGGPTNSVYVVNPTQTTSYTVTCSIPTSGAPVTCSSVVTITVNQPTCTLTAQANPTTIFNGQSTTLTATGCANGTITWSNSQQIGSTLVVSPSETTVYTASCTIPTSGSPVVCTTPITVTVIDRPTCNLQVQTITPTIFIGSTATLTATGCSGSVSWNTGQSGTSIPVSPAATTSYTATCTISTAAGSVTCLASATVTVIARPVCNLSVQANPTAIFNGQSTTLTASGCTGGTVTWSSQQNGSSIVVSPTLTTTYSATCLISTEAGSVSCTSPVSVSVTQPILQLAGSSDILPLNAVTWIGTVTQNIGSFVWQYKTVSGDWVNFPSSFDNSTSITVSATSFLRNAAPAYLNQAIQLRVLSPILISNVLTVTIRQTPPTISSLTTVKAVCSGSSTGSFSLILSRGLEAGESVFQARVYNLAGGIETLASSYTFTGSTFTSPSVFGKGSYRVRVQSIIGSQTSDETVQDFTIDDNPPITLSATKTDVLCFGSANGTISLVANGGVGPYQFAINGGAFQNFQSGAQHQINNLASGTYSIQLRDGNACLSAQPISVTIAQPVTSLTITSGVVKNPSGFQLTDGTITLNVTGGTPDYSFAWSVSNPATSTQSANPGVTHTISNLGGGTYTVIVTDKAGCTTQASYTLTPPTQLQAQFTIVKAISCARGTDGIVAVDVSGGVPKSAGDPYTYSWKVKSSGSVVADQRTSRLTNASSTTYVVTVTDGNGVSRDFDIFLPEPLPLVATVSSLTNVSCFGLANGSASVAIQGGIAPYATRWNTQQTGLSLANMQAGKYLAVITDANSCQAQVSVQIQQPQALTIATVTATPTCYDNCDGRITIAPTGGTAPYGISWQNPVSQSLSLTGLCSGSYTVAVTDANGCAVTQTTSLTRPVQKQIVLRANTFICKGQVVDLDGTITDGVTYVWTYPDGSTRTTAMVSVTAAGRYQVVATDKNGCVATAQITLTASDTPAPSLAFAVGSKVGVGEPLIAVNLTNPRPAQSSWTAPAGAQVVSSTEDQLVVTFNQLGTYPITLNGQQGQCAFAITKSVTVVAEPQLTTSVQTTPFIQELTILPNPSSGEFKVRITLSGVSDVKIKVKPLLSTGVDIYQQSATGQNVYELSVNIPNLQTGVYLLTLETAKAIQSTKLLIAR